MKKTILTFLVCFSVAFVFSQEQNRSQTQAEQLKKLDGTYTITSYHRAYFLPSNLADIIEKNRLQDKQNSVQLSEGVTLIVYPANKVFSGTVKESKSR